MSPIAERTGDRLWPTVKGLLGAGGAATILWVLDRHRFALAVLSLGVGISLASAISTRFRNGFEWLSRTAARVLLQILSATVLGASYFAVLTPVSLYKRLAGRTLVTSGFNPARASYWIPADDHPRPRSQFFDERRIYQPDSRRSLPRRAVRLAWTATTIIAVLVCANYAIGYLLPDPHRILAEPRFRQVIGTHYRGERWAEDHVQNLEYANRDGGYKFTFFLGPRMKDIESSTINVKDERRRTYQAKGLTDDSPKVFVLGGSTVWGWGQRDEHTIPSELARIAEASGTPARIVNLGQVAWTGWEEMTLLSWLLAKGERPDVVIFYDGFNDAQVVLRNPSAVDEGTPYRLQEEPDRAILEKPVDVRRFHERYSALALLKGRWRPPSAAGRMGDPLAQLDPSPLPLAEVKAASEQVDYVLKMLGTRNSHALHLATAYEYDLFVFWQPSIFSKTPLLPEERLGFLSSPIGKTRNYIVDQIRQGLPPPTIDLASALDRVATPVLIDTVHLNEKGARVIAEEIYRHIRPTLIRRASHDR
jgi:lysophospholipase L1-like esterase